MSGKRHTRAGDFFNRLLLLAVICIVCGGCQTIFDSIIDSTVGAREEKDRTDYYKRGGFDDKTATRKAYEDQYFGAPSPNR